MTIMTCPLNGPRKLSEFVRGREVKEMPDLTTCSDEIWAKRLFMDGDIVDETVEWWMHVPTSYWFIARCNTITGQIVGTYTVEDFFGMPTHARADKLAA